MRKILLALSAVVVLIFGSAAFADTKIGVVDFSKVLAEAPQLAAAKADLKKQFDPREKALNEESIKFRTAIEAFNKNGPTMKAADKEKEQNKLMGLQQKLQDMQKKMQQDLADTETKVMKDLLGKIQTAVDKIAADQKFDLIIPIIPKASAPSYSKKELDVTDEVIKQIKNVKGSAAVVEKKAEDASKKKVESK